MNWFCCAVTLHAFSIYALQNSSFLLLFYFLLSFILYQRYGCVTHSKAHNLPRASFLCLQHFCSSDPVIKCSVRKSCLLSIVSSDFSVFLCVFHNISMPCNCCTSLCICCLLDAVTCGLRNYVCSSSSVHAL